MNFSELACFSRTTQLIGSRNIEKLQQSHVGVFGLGAVGTFAIESLIRSGIGEMTIVDFDLISESNINRQIIALHSTLGQSKAQALKKRLLDINPHVIIHEKPTFIDEKSIPELLIPAYDFIVDAIDSFTPKFKVLQACVQKELPIISSMGAGGRKNPTLIKFGKLSETMVCPLARRIRKSFHRAGLDTEKLMTVYSSEIPVKALPPDQTNAEMTYQQGRLRSVNGTICYIPAIFGSLMAGYVLNALIENQRIPKFCSDSGG
ncbi:tRNA threonylcarbamoyladenosine dehydratase [candidate division KSB1 bacterium]|nr:tRNA threonylcarbamoyladenosine dehydratase [candidate division KSB1 bacterium]